MRQHARPHARQKIIRLSRDDLEARAEPISPPLPIRVAELSLTPEEQERLRSDRVQVDARGFPFGRWNRDEDEPVDKVTMFCCEPQCGEAAHLRAHYAGGHAVQLRDKLHVALRRLVRGRIGERCT